MLFLLALSCLAAATVGSVVVYQKGTTKRLREGDGRGALPQLKAPDPREGHEATLDALRPGDVVLDGDDDFVVQGAVRYREERDTWSLFFLDGGNEERLLEVRKRGGALVTTFFSVVEDAPIFGQLGTGLTYRGKPFSLDARGDARTQVEGEAGDRAGALLKYARYAGPGGETLVVEEEGVAKRALFGHQVPPDSLSIYGGELPSSDEPA